MASHNGKYYSKKITKKDAASSMNLEHFFVSSRKKQKLDDEIRVHNVVAADDKNHESPTKVSHSLNEDCNGESPTTVTALSITTTCTNVLECDDKDCQNDIDLDQLDLDRLVVLFKNAKSRLMVL